MRKYCVPIEFEFFSDVTPDVTPRELWLKPKYMTERTSITQEMERINLPTQLANNKSAGEMELAIDTHS